MNNTFRTEDLSLALARRAVIQGLPLDIRTNQAVLARRHIEEVMALQPGFPQKREAFTARLRQQQHDAAHSVIEVFGEKMKALAHEMDLKAEGPHDDDAGEAPSFERQH
jgi:hypothetical protein